MTKQDQPRVAVITGASSGIGKEISKALAAQGWRIIGIGRDAARSRTAEAEIRAASTSGEVEMLRADLSLLRDSARVAAEVAARTDRVDLLVNNAGGMVKEKVITAEGHESCFAGNHLGPFVLTQRLLPLLRTTAAHSPRGSVRILNTTSDASEMVPGLDWNDLESVKQFNPGLSYCRAKLANVLFARALARRLDGEGIVAHAIHPGTVDSNFITHADEATQARIRTYPSVSPAQGADTLIWLATDDAGGKSNGGYFYQRNFRKASAFADDPANADRLWQESENIAATLSAQ
jgi:NAD(P)-dependent dehydrogenase (short-subunit alcohol dehydrogenase family)